MEENFKFIEEFLQDRDWTAYQLLNNLNEYISFKNNLKETGNEIVSVHGIVNEVNGNYKTSLQKLPDAQNNIECSSDNNKIVAIVTKNNCISNENVAIKIEENESSVDECHPELVIANHNEKVNGLENKNYENVQVIKEENREIQGFTKDNIQKLENKLEIDLINSLHSTHEILTKNEEDNNLQHNEKSAIEKNNLIHENGEVCKQNGNEELVSEIKEESVAPNDVINKENVSLDGKNTKSHKNTENLLLNQNKEVLKISEIACDFVQEEDDRVNLECVREEQIITSNEDGRVNASEGQFPSSNEDQRINLEGERNERFTIYDISRINSENGREEQRPTSTEDDRISSEDQCNEQFTTSKEDHRLNSECQKVNSENEHERPFLGFNKDDKVNSEDSCKVQFTAANEDQEINSESGRNEQFPTSSEDGRGNSVDQCKEQFTISSEDNRVISENKCNEQSATSLENDRISVEDQSDNQITCSEKNDQPNTSQLIPSNENDKINSEDESNSQFTSKTNLTDEETLKCLKIQLDLLRNRRNTAHPFLSPRKALLVHETSLPRKRVCLQLAGTSSDENQKIAESQPGCSSKPTPSTSFAATTSSENLNNTSNNSNCEEKSLGDVSNNGVNKKESRMVDKLFKKFFGDEDEKSKENTSQNERKPVAAVSNSGLKTGMTVKIDDNGKVKIDLNNENSIESNDKVCVEETVNKNSDSNLNYSKDELPFIRFKKFRRKKFKNRINENILSKKREQEKQFEQRNSCMVYNGQVLRLTSKKSSKKPLAIVNDIIKSSQNENKKKEEKEKLSILPKSELVRISYKPGPLCKKSQLQANYLNEWRTEIRKLPQVYLIVKPEIGKVINPKIRHFLTETTKDVISEKMATFALSTLVCKQSNTIPSNTSFIFPVTYKNGQESILVRKHIRNYNKNNERSTEAENILNEVVNVIDKLITYVEIKEIEPTVIKDDINEFENNEENDSVLVQEENVNSNQGISHVTSRKKRKIDIELRRLNCKVIDVNNVVESDNKQCNKSYCKLGCICDSIKCKNIQRNHCKNLKCMFNCTCPIKIKSLNQLSSSSMDKFIHLDTVAKKDLAKVEKEFTQTVIHTGTNTIVLGTNANNKNKRTSRLPAKYNDYVNNIDDILKIKTPNKNVEETPQVSSTSTQVPDTVYVSAVKLNIDGLVPYCMFHNLHDCDCELRKKKVERSKQLVKNSLNKLKKRSHIIVENGGCATTETDDTNEEVKKKKRKSDTCARVREIFSQYSSRYKNVSYNRYLHKCNARLMRRLNIESYMESNDNDSENQEEISEEKPNKRKQSFKIREDSNESETDFAIQRRKKIVKRNIMNFSSDNSLFDQKIYEAEESAVVVKKIFEDEIKIPVTENSDFSKIFSQDIGFVRLLPWNSFINSFYNKKINVWCRNSQPTILLVNTIDKAAPKNYEEIRKTNQKAHIIQWILTKTLPAGIVQELVYILLKPSKAHFEIAGMCLKNSNNQLDDSNISSNFVLNEKIREDMLKSDDTELNFAGMCLENSNNQLDNSNISSNFVLNEEIRKDMLKSDDIELNFNVGDLSNDEKSLEFVNPNEIWLRDINFDDSNNSKEITFVGSTPEENENLETINKNTDEKPLTKDKILEMFNNSLLNRTQFECMHKNYNNEMKKFVLTKHSFSLKKLKANKLNDFKPINVGLPNISTSCKWYMVNINEDNSYLFFKKSNYSIRYTDIKCAIQMSKRFQQTILISNVEFSKNYSMAKFGIYCVGNYENRCFIGPVASGETTNIYDVYTPAMNKSPEDTKGVWLIQNKINFRLSKKPSTEINEEKHESQSPNDDVGQPPRTNHSTKTKRFKRYIVTNIPNLGHLEAYQRVDCKFVDVRWPGTNQLLSFHSPAAARRAIQAHLSYFLHPVTKDLDLNIIIVTHLNSENNMPLNPAYFDGHHKFDKSGIIEKFYPDVQDEDKILQALNNSCKFISVLKPKYKERFKFSSPNLCMKGGANNEDGFSTPKLSETEAKSPEKIQILSDKINLINNKVLANDVELLPLLPDNVQINSNRNSLLKIENKQKATLRKIVNSQSTNLAESDNNF